jgi:hypothetical protein
LWAIDLHNRMAHLGLSLRPEFRGRRLGTDVVLALCVYGFTVLNSGHLSCRVCTLGAPVLATQTGRSVTMAARKRESTGRAS